jgi:hypothetical protein
VDARQRRQHQVRKGVGAGTGHLDLEPAAVSRLCIGKPGTVRGDGTMPNIPPRANRRWKNRFSPVLYRDRNAVERMVCRLKDFRRVATRYDRLAVNFRAAVCIAATVSYWL